ncbi:MAG: hypothetical protein ACMUEL_08660 [Flavobacteriales bacterium Tduv]
MAGGGSILGDLNQGLSKKRGFPIFLIEEPLRAVVSGMALAPKKYRKIHISNEITYLNAFLCAKY